MTLSFCILGHIQNPMTRDLPDFEPPFTRGVFAVALTTLLTYLAALPMYICQWS